MKIKKLSKAAIARIEKGLLPLQTEGDFQKQVLRLAKNHGWRTAHFRPGLNQRGKWQTAVQGDGAGFPDLLLIRGTCCFVVELKSDRGVLSDEQRLWLDSFEAAGIRAFVWTPAMWSEIEYRLKFGGNSMTDELKTTSLREHAEYVLEKWRTIDVPKTVEDHLRNAAILVAEAWHREHPEGAPNWYSEAEINEYLRRNGYPKNVADCLAGDIAKQYQLAFNKGFSMGGKTDLQAAYQQLAHLWEQTGSCPCGARRNSLRTHSHVAGCPTAKAIDELKEGNKP